MNTEYIQAKSILSPIKNGPDPYFGIKYSMNLYRGCQHGCIYCDTRSKVYNVGELSTIRLKQNGIDLLARDIKRLKTKGTIGTGSMNDPYMPIEQKEQLILKALEIIQQSKFPVHIMTKSNLVLRDIDIIKEIGKTYAAVSFTITTANDTIAKIIEPGAPVSSERLHALRTLSQMGIYTGIVLSPVLPFITDSEENIERIVQMASKAGAKYILAWMGFTQREGQIEYFYSKLQKNFPGLEKKYHTLYNNRYSCEVPDSKTLYKAFNNMCKDYNIATRMEHYNPTPPRQLNLFS
ncbi:MAG: radical SAM protein [Bacteroidales bacterium]|nr:radical SAM protein [Bacteroidales bacterium]MBN2821182.1 radical SAM protein [Bacteroidales bacterium]